MRRLRPYALVRHGALEMGWEVDLDSDGRIVAMRPQTGPPDDIVLSPAFVNGHSHFEYRAMQGRLDGSRGFADWIAQIASAKREESLDEVFEACMVAARENVTTGVAFVAEHSDRPGAADAMRRVGLAGHVLHEIISIAPDADARRTRAESNAEESRRLGFMATLNPHAVYTNRESVLRDFADGRSALSLHLAESREETEYLAQSQGPFAEGMGRLGVSPEAPLARPLERARRTGYLRKNVQLVHVCDLNETEIEAVAASGCTVAHCPRSNVTLQCPRAPISELLRAGVPVSLGLDSAASSGAIDFFAEMRAAIATSRGRGRPLTAEQVWHMACTGGAQALMHSGLNVGRWDWEVGAKVPMIAIHVPGAWETEDVIDRARPEDVEWVVRPNRTLVT